MTHILSESQARAVYNCMCLMSKVNGKIGKLDVAPGVAVIEDRHEITVFGRRVVTGTIEKGKLPTEAATETYATQFDFAAAYGVTNEVQKI